MTTFSNPDLTRDAIEERYRWNLDDIYPSEAAWRAEKQRLEAQLPAMARCAGTLHHSSVHLADALDLLSDLRKTAARLHVYAGMLSDQDTRVAHHQGMKQEMATLGAALGAAAAFVEPELLQLPRATVDAFLAEQPRLAIYRQELDDILRRAPHTLSAAEERLLASAGPLAGAPSSVYTIVCNADFQYPSVTLSDGRQATVTQARYAELRASTVRADRESAMRAFFERMGEWRRTFGTTMNGSVQKLRFFAEARRYDSALACALDGPNVPTSVYLRLVDGVQRHLAAFHRYLRLRQRMLGVSQLHYYDLYAPLVADVERTYTPDEAAALIVDAMAPLGAEYQAVIARAFRERWIDMYPSQGKRSGAYSNGGAYDVHPYILMNYQGQYNDVSTLAHELGHTMQSYLSNAAQPFPTADYPIFVAEVASTFNESLLLDHMLRTIDDDEMKLSLLGNYLEGIKGTVFRQTQFAEFELRMHEMAWRGEPITGDALAALYLDLTRRYYGHDAGVCIVDDYIQHEWSFIPHFYRDFYVFQYATSFTASEALAQPVKAGDTAATERFLTFLSAGCSKYPVDLLRDAGVDMTTDAPLDLTMQEMHRVMDEMERVLARRERS